MFFSMSDGHLMRWFWVAVACFILFVSVSGWPRKPLKADYMRRLNLSPEQADMLFAPLADKLYGFLEKSREIVLCVVAIAILVVNFVPSGPIQSWSAIVLQIAWALTLMCLGFLGVFRARTSAKVRRLYNIDNFIPDTNGNAPKSGQIYTVEIYFTACLAHFYCLASVLIYIRWRYT